MKYQYKEMPESMRGTYGAFSKNFGFDWKEFIMGIPTPMFLVTTYKSNVQLNATRQSWAGFTSANQGGGYYVILCSVNKCGHLYQRLHEKKNQNIYSVFPGHYLLIISMASSIVTESTSSSQTSSL